MCDVYTRKCETCERDISVHIADFCTKRENVHPYCPPCARKLKKGGIPSTVKMFEEILTNSGKWCGVQGGRKGQKVIFLCDDKDAHGVGLNA